MIRPLLQGVCPKCHGDKIFKTSGSFTALKMPVMNEKCSKCGLVFDKEPGYFLGAMYMSYGLAVLQLMIVFFIFVNLVSLPWLFFIMFLTLIGCMFFNYRYARISYIYIFYKH
jgi:uncharacterized protein (DUF983 family)